MLEQKRNMSVLEQKRNRLLMDGLLVVLMLWSLVSMIGCATTDPDPVASFPAAKYGNWTNTGSYTPDPKEDPALYAVGEVSNVGNSSLAWDAAENRARANLVKRFQSYIAVLMRDYAASANKDGNGNEQQDVERAIKTFASMTLYGVYPVDRACSSETRSCKVLVRMSGENLKAQLLESKNLPDAVKAYVQKNSERMFELLQQEESKAK